jgi:hypothetical protein
MACRLTVEVTGEDVQAGVATRIRVFGTAAAGCPAVRVTAATSLTAAPMFSEVATVSYPPPSSTNPDDPANDGRFVVEFAAPGSGIFCEAPLFVMVACLADPTCSVIGFRPTHCKAGGPGGGGDDGTGGPGGGSGNGDDNGSWDWPFGDPPSIVCPVWGRVFVNMLLPAMLTLVGGLSFGNAIAIGVGLLMLTGAMGWFAFWSVWCVPPTCGVLTAWTWVLKICVAEAISLATVQMFVIPNPVAWFLVPALGIPVGWLVTELRNRRCPIPPITATVQQLRLW